MAVASAPGRVNVIGEHTDHQGGFVLPTAVAMRVRVQVERRDDRRVLASSAAFGGGWVEVGDEPAGEWTDHVLGAATVLSQRGFSARIASEIPLGAGLGSSGALGVALIRALREEFALSLDEVQVAELAQRSENEVAGARSGIMDQMAASLGTEGQALFLDCRSLAFERVRVPEALELVVVHSGVTHRHAAGRSPYNELRRECEAAARALGLALLRDAGADDRARIDALPEPLARRARHVVSENARVLEAVAALRAGDLGRLGALLDASHRSLRDDLEVSTPEVELLVELVREQDGVHGARICGGGFGGSIVAVADAGGGHRAAALAVAEYEQRTGLDARILLPPTMTP